MAERMREDVWKAFVTEGTRTGKVSTVRPDGSPNIAPMWFLLDGGHLVFTTENDTMTGRNLRRDVRAALCVDDERPPFSFAVLRGRAEISEDPGQLLTCMLLVRLRIEHVTAYAAIA
jgi:PPOX class probable F420-dependent enzyme